MTFFGQRFSLKDCLSASANRRSLRRFATNERGAYAIMTAVALPVVVGAFGFLSETAGWYQTRQFQQGAADAAAMSAAMELAAGTGAHIAVAKAIAASNGFVDGQKGVTVTVNSPPLSGTKTGAAGAVEVIIGNSEPATYSSALNFQSTLIKARSTASSQDGLSCVMALGTANTTGIRAQGNVTVSASQCSLVSNASGSSSVQIGGSQTNVSVGAIRMAGSLNVSGNPTIVGAQTANAPAVADPYERLPIQTPSGSCVAFQANQLASPGTHYCSMDIGNSTVNLPAGVYYISGAFRIRNNGTLTGTGVTLIFGSAASFQITGGQITLVAPTTGTYKGLVMVGSRAMPNNTEMKFTGQSNATITGAIYMPKVDLTFRGGSSNTNGCTQLVTNTVDFGGNSSLQMNCSAYGLKHPATKIALVE